MRRILLYPVGVLSLASGAALLILPGPGLPFIFMGLLIVSPRHASRLRGWVGRKLFPQEAFRWAEWRPFRVKAGFTGRRFPLSLRKTDDLSDFTNQRTLEEHLWKSRMVFSRKPLPSMRYAFLEQIHGSNLVVLDESKIFEDKAFRRFPGADGAITNLPGLTLLVLTADCLSIFLCAVRRKGGRSTGEWVGLLHAGWRGTREEIARKGVELLAERSGVAPKDVFAAFGPCIGARRYEVGEEFRSYFPSESFTRFEGKLTFDLAGENRRQLLRAGIPASQIMDAALCTASGIRDFYSYRIEKAAAGRMVSFMAKE